MTVGARIVRSLARLISGAVALLLLGLLAAYRLAVGPLLHAVVGPTCRFAPSCSSYAVQAVRLHGPWRGGWLAARRLLRCQPWHPGGFDPVPPRHDSADPARRRSDGRSMAGVGSC